MKKLFRIRIKNYLIIIIVLFALSLTSQRVLALSKMGNVSMSILGTPMPEGLYKGTFSEIISENGCSPDSGWMWVPGPFMPDVSSKIQSDLQSLGITAKVDARGYGEIDGCGTYFPQGVDYTVSIKDPQSERIFSQRELADLIVPLLMQPSNPMVGNVKLVSTQGQTLSVDLRAESPALQVTANEPLSANANAITKQVYVIVYDPVLSSGQTLSEFMGWNDYGTITQQTIDFFKQASDYQVNYAVADTTIIGDRWPELIDGFTYTETTYLDVWAHPENHHEPTGVNYNKIVNTAEFDICGKLNRGEIDEVWVYNGPWFGFYESTLIGPEAFWYNSPPVSGEHGCNRLLPIMGPSVERTVDEAVHNFGHRTESTMVQIYGSWAQNNISHSWNQFALVDALSPNYSYSGCGNIHYPPNGASDYDYVNVSTALSNCNDFANYPNLGDPLSVAQPVNCSSWGCLSLDYLGYWFGHLPKNVGCGTDGYAANWWKYFIEPSLALYPSYGCQENAHFISGATSIGNSSLSYTDSTSNLVNTDSYGNYFLFVSDQWSGTITPQNNDGFIFNPSFRDYSNVATNLYSQNYASSFEGPKIVVSGGITEISNGDFSPSAIDGTDFGFGIPGEGGIVRTFVIENTGTEDLLLTGDLEVEIGGVSASDFSVITPPSRVIPPLTSSSFTVEFNPNDSGLRSAVISIASNDGYRSPFSFLIQGIGSSSYYVDSATGNDTNSCMTVDAPCQNIQEAINKASVGDAVYVTDEIYHFSSNASPNVVIINKDILLSGGWNSDFTSQDGASIIDGDHVNNGILVISGDITVKNFIIENATSSNSGAIYVAAGNFTLQNSTLRNNVATNNGGGIFLDGGDLMVINSTISGNTANSSGGGIFASIATTSSVAIRNSTIAYNNAATGGGLLQDNAVITMTNSIIANNSSSISGVDCQGVLDVANFNIIENLNGCFISSGENNNSVNPNLSSGLEGTMLVYRPLLGSPAIDAGDETSCPAEDQVGVVRPQGDFCDIGAVEYLETTVVSILRLSPSPTNAVSVEFEVAFSSPVSGVDLTDFSLTTTGDIDASLGGVSGKSTTYTVSVDINSGNSGTLRLDVLNDETIVTVAGYPLSNEFIDGEVYVIDNIMPDTMLLSFPDDPSNDLSPSFEFSSTESPATFECQLDSAGYSLCSSPQIYTEMSDGQHTFNVQALDVAGNMDESPASYSWNIDTQMPDTYISSFPASINNDSVVLFEFDSLDNDTTFFECKLDEGDYGLCVSPKSYSDLVGGTHTFFVRAVDAAGNADGSPAVHIWENDQSAPDVSSSVRVDADPTSNTKVRFTVSFSEIVTGVDKTDFALTTTGDISDASISTVTGDGATYTVLVDTGIGNGTLRLDVIDDDSIVDYVGNLLGGIGLGNGNYNSGETYTIDRAIPSDNDDFDFAKDIETLSYADRLSTYGSTVADDDPTVGACGIIGKGTATVWYKYNSDANEAISINTLNTDYDTFIAVWTGTRGEGNLSLVTCNNDFGGTQQSSVAFQVTNGTVYYIEIGQP